MMKIGDTIKTLYGAGEVVKINDKSIGVKLLSGHTKTVSRTVIDILNGSK